VFFVWVNYWAGNTGQRYSHHFGSQARKSTTSNVAYINNAIICGIVVIIVIVVVFVIVIVVSVVLVINIVVLVSCGGTSMGRELVLPVKNAAQILT